MKKKNHSSSNNSIKNYFQVMADEDIDYTDNYIKSQINAQYCKDKKLSEKIALNFIRFFISYENIPLSIILENYFNMQTELATIKSTFDNVFNEGETFTSAQKDISYKQLKNTIDETRIKYGFSTSSSRIYDKPIQIEYFATVTDVSKSIDNYYCISYSINDIKTPSNFYFNLENYIYVKNKKYALSLNRNDNLHISVICYLNITEFDNEKNYKEITIEYVFPPKIKKNKI